MNWFNNLQFTLKLAILALPGLLAFAGLAVWNSHQYKSVEVLDELLINSASIRADMMELGFSTQSYVRELEHGSSEVLDINRSRVKGILYRLELSPEWLEDEIPALAEGLANILEQSGRILDSSVLTHDEVLKESKILVDQINAYNTRLLHQIRIYNDQEAEMHDSFIMVSYAILGLGITTYLLFLAGVQPLIIVPLKRFVTLTKKLAGGDFDERAVIPWRDELGQLASSFNSMAKEIQYAHGELQKLTVMDDLTRVLNHRGFQENLHKEVERARRHGRSLTLIMMDVDHFKKVNDTYGHPAGDAVLKEIARTVAGEARTSDTVARYGGEEFMALLGETDINGGKILAERMRKIIEAMEISTGDGKRINVTVSMGVACFPLHADNQEDLVSVADKYLYKAKESGRNCVCVAEEVINTSSDSNG